jgi:hypothetical protein
MRYRGFDKMVTYKNYLNRKELEHAELYINDINDRFGKTDNLGNPIRENLPFSSNNIPNKRKEVSIDKILKLK